MMQTAYSIETLRAAFPPLPSSPKAMGGGGRAAGARKVRASQPLNLRELIENPPGKDRSADTLRFAGEAARAGWSADDIKAQLLDPQKPISAHCRDQADPERAADRVIDKAFVDVTDPEQVTFAPTSYVWVPPEKIPRLDLILGNWLIREEASLIIAPGGVGKTTFVASAAVSLVTGVNLLGKTVTGGPKRVWIWNLEDSVAMMTRSIQAAAKLHGIKPEQLGDRLFLDTSRDGAPLCTAKKTGGGLTILEPVHEALVVALIDKKIDVLIVDPFVSSHEGNENDNGEMDRVLKGWCRVAQRARCAVVLCHHTSKAGSAEVNTMRARGAVALTAAARVVLVLNAMNPTEASKLGIDEDERWRLFQVTMDKSNRAPLEKGDWYRKASVPLGPGDSAGAVEPWSPPEAADLLTPTGLAGIKLAWGARDWRESSQSPEWAGFVVAEALGFDSPDVGTPARGKVNRIISELIKQGHVTKQKIKEANSKMVPVLQLAPHFSTCPE